MGNLTIPKSLTKGEDLVVLRRKEYEMLLKHLDELQDALHKISIGERELRQGKTRVFDSLAALR